MALSDVTVNVNITSAAGSEGTWFPLILAAGSAVDAACSYKECYNLNQIVDVTAGYMDSDTRAERVAKTEKAKNTYLYGAADKICQQNQPPNRIAIPLPTPEINPPKRAHSSRSCPARGEAKLTSTGSTSVMSHAVRE